MVSWGKDFFSKVCSIQTNRQGLGGWFPGGLFLTFTSTAFVSPPSLYIPSLWGLPAVGLRSGAERLFQ